MKKKECIGICKLCGKTKKLTFEHVPPEGAFNDQPSKVRSLEAIYKNNGYKFEIVPEEVHQSKQYTSKQRGTGDFYLCDECNNKTGSWYISEYVRFARTMAVILAQASPQSNQLLEIELDGFKPLQVFKAIMVMFCDINSFCIDDERLQRFLTDKYSKDFDSNKYQITMYLTNSRIELISPSYVVRRENKMFSLSKIICFPIGLELYTYNIDGYKPRGTCLNSFLECDYDEECKATMCLTFINNDSVFPA